MGRILSFRVDGAEVVHGVVLRANHRVGEFQEFDILESVGAVPARDMICDSEFLAAVVIDAMTATIALAIVVTIVLERNGESAKFPL